MKCVPSLSPLQYLKAFKRNLNLIPPVFLSNSRSFHHARHSFSMCSAPFFHKPRISLSQPPDSLPAALPEPSSLLSPANRFRIYPHGPVIFTISCMSCSGFSVKLIPFCWLPSLNAPGRCDIGRLTGISLLLPHTICSDFPFDFLFVLYLAGACRCFFSNASLFSFNFYSTEGRSFVIFVFSFHVEELSLVARESSSDRNAFLGSRSFPWLFFSVIFSCSVAKWICSNIAFARSISVTGRIRSITAFLLFLSCTAE